MAACRLNDLLGVCFEGLSIPQTLAQWASHLVRSVHPCGMFARSSRFAIPTGSKLLQVRICCSPDERAHFGDEEAAQYWCVCSRLCRAAMSAAEVDLAEVQDELADLYMLFSTGDCAQVEWVSVTQRECCMS